ncbi:MAG: hypothetical protein FWF84_01330, partial [Kiritimatiellaeota bacterium]|nr:hypothetical protein [Kiritimatiellota bacterium]
RGQTAEELKKSPPRWHYVAWALRKPWENPTFNVAVGGVEGGVYWKRYGAQDEAADRYPTVFGPVEVSSENVEGRMDITALLNDETYGETLGKRLLGFERQGVLIKKWETYDVKYADWSAYEWAVPSGVCGLTFGSARLEMTLGEVVSDQWPVISNEIPPEAVQSLTTDHCPLTTDGGSTAVYWTKYGASNTEHDRYPTVFGPAELSVYAPVARLDVTAVLTGEEYGKTLGERLRRFEEQGIVMQKWELYDTRYHANWTSPGSSYEWIVGMGGSAIVATNAALVVTMAHRTQNPELRTQNVVLPPATDLTTLAVGNPTAVMPSDEEIAAMKGMVFHRRAWMAEWQWDNIRQMEPLTRSLAAKDWDAGDPKRYRAAADNLMRLPPRWWQGFSSSQQLLNWYLYRDVMPAPVRDHFLRCWDALMMSDRPSETMYHMQQTVWDGGTNKYYRATGDWRGNGSFYRGSYTRAMSTMGFNHAAVAGALLGGAMVGSERAIEDGRYGLEHLILRLWNKGGTSQQSMEFNYLPISLVPQKMFADHGITPFDRLIGRVVVGRMVDEIAASYHPGLRRIIYPIGRTSLMGMLTWSSGLNAVMHTMSPSGALFMDDLTGDMAWTNRIDNQPVLDVIDGPPDTIAYFSLTHPWLPQWCTNMVDPKIMPARATVQGEWDGLKRNYLGNHYGMASTLKAGEYQAAPVMAQWKFTEAQASSARAIRSLTPNYWWNEADARFMYNHRVESVDTVQQDNAMIVLMTPTNFTHPSGTNVTALLGSIAFFSFEQGSTGLPTCASKDCEHRSEDLCYLNAPSWKVYVDETPVTALPFACKQGQRITIHDGVTYLGIIPLPATDLGRDREVVIEGVKTNVHPEKYTVPMFISTYNMAKDESVDLTTLSDGGASEGTASGGRLSDYNEAVAGFVIEMGDVTEWGSFDNFQKAFHANPLATAWDAERKSYAVDFTTKAGHFELSYLPAEAKYETVTVDGKYPFPPADILRDTDYSQIGIGGSVSKNGATLTFEEGRPSWLQTDPASGAFAFINMLPDMNLMRLEGERPREPIVVAPNGRVSMMRVDVEPNNGESGTISVQYGFRPDQLTDDAATAILVTGFATPPKVIINDVVFTGELAVTEFEGVRAFVIPLQ